MISPLWTILVLVSPLHCLSLPSSPIDSNCLYRRSRCLHDSACRLRIVQFDSICGESHTECLASSPSDCVNLLWQMKHWLGDDRCDCHPLFGAVRECDRFRHLLYEHPCETHLKREPGRDEYRSIGVTRDYGRRRTTRSPSSVQINEWKKQLSGELLPLATTTQLQSQECDVALNQICLRHVSCSQLWNLFRKNCDVDSDNACIMQQREACWESFEGLLWTGLGRCHCSSNVSDCHWIRLHTNFNKCIYEISRSSGMSLSSFLPLPQPPPTPPPTQRVSFVNFASQSVSTSSPVTVSPPTVPPTPVLSTTESVPIPTITIPRPQHIPTTQPSQWTHNVYRQEDRRDSLSNSVHGQQSQPRHPSQSIDNRQSYPEYRNPVPPTPDPRIDERSQIRVNYGNQQDRYSPGYDGRGNDRLPVYPTVSPTDYSNPSYEETGQRGQGERQEYNRQEERRQGNQHYRVTTPDPYRRQEYNRQDEYRNVVPTHHTHQYIPSTEYSPHSRQDNRRPDQYNYGISPTQSRTDYGRSDTQQRGGEGNRREDETDHVDGSGRSRSRSEEREDYRMGQITQSNGRGETRQRGDGVRNQTRIDSSPEAPQHISLVNNQERSRDEYQVSSPGITPSLNNPTIITSSSTSSRAKGMEEEEKRRKKEEEEKKKEEKRLREEKKEREREERRRMEEKRRKEEEDRRQREREEKIREEDEKKIEDERRRKEKEREEKRKEKERQEKISSSRHRESTDSVSSSSSSCLSSLRDCESVTECKFQLAELKTRCAKNCDVKQCQGALRRFISYSPQEQSLSLSFCSCSNGEENCPEKELLYPPCLYERRDVPRCENVIEECRREYKCKQLLTSMSTECPIVRGACDGGVKCSQLIIKARGSIIDTQCRCKDNDQTCLSLKAKMIPNHPCLGESRREFHRSETQESSISLRPVKNDHSIDEDKKTPMVVSPPSSRPSFTTTPQSSLREEETAPWIITTPTVPTTTTEYTTHAPPPAEGCSLRDSKGRSLFFHVGTILRRNLDWSGRCSSWCECVSEEVLKCHGLPCSNDVNCTSHAPQFTHRKLPSVDLFIGHVRNTHHFIPYSIIDHNETFHSSSSFSPSFLVDQTSISSILILPFSSPIFLSLSLLHLQRVSTGISYFGNSLSSPSSLPSSSNSHVSTRRKGQRRRKCRLSLFESTVSDCISRIKDHVCARTEVAILVVWRRNTSEVQTVDKIF